MKYVRCPKCGYIGDGLEQSCIRCGASLAGAQQFDELPADTPPSAYTAAKAWAVAATQAPGGDADYPYARRFAHILRVFAKINYWGSLILLALGVIVLLLGGFSAPFLGSGGFIGKTGAMLGGVVGAILLAVIGYAFIWLTYIWMMALPDLILCHLAIERNTRARE
jgi:hypothetical protein